MEASLKRKFLDRALADAPVKAGAERHLSAWLSRELEYVDSLERAARLRELCPVAGAAAEDYAARLVEFTDGARAVLQVRFKGGDPTSPFVQWVAGDAPFAGAGGVHRRAAEALEAYAALKPRVLRIWIPAGAAWEPEGVKGMRTLAAPVGGLGRPDARVGRVSAGEVFERYVSEYRAFVRANPHAAEWIREETLESLLACDAQDALFALKEEGAIRGIVALRRQASPWFDGWHVVESLVFEGFRGRGLAAPMHRGAYARLKSEPEDFVWGTIEPGNRASVATARSVGRADLGGDWWVSGNGPAAGTS